MLIAIYLASGAAIGLTLTYLCSRWAGRMPTPRDEFLASSDDWGVQ